MRQNIDGLSVEITGPEDGRPVLFGHSLLLDGRMWEAQIPDLSRSFRCVNIDFRGHGQSAIPPRGFAMADQAEDYRKVMDALGLASATIVGLSMGAMAAMHLAVAHPARVKALVLMNTSHEPEPPKARAKDMALAVMARVLGLREFIVKQVEPLMFGERFRGERPEIVAKWSKMMGELDKRAVYRTVKMVMSRPAVGPRLADVRAPTLVIASDQDIATPPVLGRAIADTIPGAEHVLLPRTGHISTVEQPEVTTKLIRSFLERHA